ncbi:hypothetical protein LshimejAT787_0312240 [Lyophyllum shimeji]|uniref:DNA 3'-5' helicase n=1 Tax=Lyophyllum shimeji TaxID=47721 RepID=A0A9P3PIR2_LYOSH|nr:hypothetical protein LshimejAT787_0312240 [Lyophyllum shimeji]
MTPHPEPETALYLDELDDGSAAPESSKPRKGKRGTQKKAQKSSLTDDLPVAGTSVIDTPLPDAVGTSSEVIAVVSAASGVTIDSGDQDVDMDRPDEYYVPEDEPLDDEDDEDAEDLDDEEEHLLDVTPVLRCSPDQVEEIQRRLAGYELSVDLTYNRIICLFCESLVSFRGIHVHALKHTVGSKRRFTVERRIPAKEVLEALLSQLNAHLPVKLPRGAIKPFEGIPVVKGFRCMAAQCQDHDSIFSSTRTFNNHCKKEHPEYPPTERPCRTVDCQALSKILRNRKFVEITYVPQADVDALNEILAHADAIGLGDLSDTYTLTGNTHARDLVYSLTDWDLWLKGVHIGELRRTTLPATQEGEPDLYRLKEVVRKYYRLVADGLGELDVFTRRLIRNANPHVQKDHRPFMKPQELPTLEKYSDYIHAFLIFLLRHMKCAMPEYMIQLHPNSLALLDSLRQLLADTSTSDSILVEQVHDCVWSLLSQPSPQFLRSASQDIFSRFLLVDHLFDDNGVLVPAAQLPHDLARAQWGFRATACKEVLRLSEATGQTPQRCYEENVRPWIHEGGQHLFGVLRSNMELLTTVVKTQPGIARFNWDVNKTVLTIDDFPIQLNMFYNSINDTLDRVAGLIKQLFRGCAYDDILSFIDFRLDPHPMRTRDWFRDEPLKQTIKFSIFSHPQNGWEKFEHRLLSQLSRDGELLQRINGSLKSRPGLWGWFALLDEIVGLLFCLSSTTWGGGARGTECDNLKYANNKDGGRNMFIFSNILTFAPAYDKNRNIHGTGRRIAHSPSYRVSRLLLLVLGIVYPAAAKLAIYCHMAKEDAENYLSYVFVQNGKVMTSEHFSRALTSFTYDSLGRGLKLRDWRQVMCTIMVNVGHIDFGLPDDDDEDLKAIHRAFNHSVEIGESRYALQTSNSLAQFSHTAIASDQRVCFRWHACIGQLHPTLAEQFKEFNTHDEHSREDMFKELDRILEPVLRAILREYFGVYFDELGGKLLGEMREQYLSLAPYVAQQVLTGIGLAPTVTAQRKQQTILVHPNLLSRLASLLPYGRELRWTCPEQAELVQACLTDKHVLAVLPTGSGKTLSFFGAALIHPQDLFLVILPLKALVDDMERRLAATSINGGVYPRADGSTSRIVLVPYNLAATDEFREWSQASRYRLNRIFVDEAHQIYTSDFRKEFALLTNLTALKKPITFLSATIFPRSVDILCDWMKIPRELLYEIRAPTNRKNIQYRVEHVEDKQELEDRLIDLVKSVKLEDDERGLIYCKSIGRVERLKAKLQFPHYISHMEDDKEKNAQLKIHLQEAWRRGKEPGHKWMIATACFGQGIDYAKVRYVIHYDVRGIMDFVQEVGRAGRDGGLAYSVLFWSKKPGLWEDKQPGDHTGLAEMGEFLTTKWCRLLKFECVDGVAHSCPSIPGAPLCDNCLSASLSDHNNIKVHNPIHFDAPSVQSEVSRRIAARAAGVAPSTSSSSRPKLQLHASHPQTTPSSTIIPPTLPVVLNVETNGALAAADIQGAIDQFRVLKRAIDQILAVGCPDCWVTGTLDPSPMPHTHQRPLFFREWFAVLQRNHFPAFKYWPLCYTCWLPFFDMFGHCALRAGEAALPSKCVHNNAISRILPTVIALIATQEAEDGSKPVLDRLAARLDVDVSTWRNSVGLNRWLCIAPLDFSQIPNPARFVIEFYLEYRQLGDVPMEVD